MSIATISYSSLGKASGEAKAVAKKLNKYADSLYDDVYKKLNKYDGGWSSNLSTASSKVNSKISELQNEARKYDAYATDLAELRQDCKTVDKAVRSRVSSLTASFRERNGIRNYWLEEAVSYFVVSTMNKTARGRFTGNKDAEWVTDKKNLISSIKEWYNYGGGKQAIKATLVIVLDAAIAVAGVVAAVATFLAGALTIGAVIVVAAAMVAAAISAQNIYTDIVNETAAYKARQEGDPATANRRSEINSFSDYLRSSYMFGDDGQTYFYNKTFNDIAFGLDVADTACKVISFINGAGKLLKSGYKWVSGANKADFKAIFSKDGFGHFKNKIIDIGHAFKSNGWQAVKDWGGQAWSNFGRGMKNQFWDFFKVSGDFNLAGAASSIKNMLTIPHDLINDGFNLKNIFKVGFKEIVLPSTVGFIYDDSDPSRIIMDPDGQMKYDYTNITTLGDITELLDKGIKSVRNINEMSSKDINLDILSKLSKPSGVDISIPEINFPEINMPKTKIPSRSAA